MSTSPRLVFFYEGMILHLCSVKIIVTKEFQDIRELRTLWPLERADFKMPNICLGSLERERQCVATNFQG